MEGDRIKLGYDLNDENAILSKDIFPHLMARQFDPETQYFEFLITGKLTPEIVKSFLALPYEISLTELSNRLVLNTGTRYSVGHLNEYFLKRMNNSKVSFHVHPKYEGESTDIGPSFGDVHASGSVSKDIPLSLAHVDGVMIYQRPVFDPVIGESCEHEDVRAVMHRYATNRRVSFFKLNSKLNYFGELTGEERVKFFRQFAETTGMIVDEALWKNESDIERIISRIFGFLD